ncbi:MAG: hypothetical protein AAGA11_03965 [Pseudomonadota bacterium]
MNFTSPLWRFMAALCCSVIMVFLAGVVLERASNHLDPSYPNIKSAFQMRDRSFDLVVLGDSTTSQGVNPVAALEGSDWSGFNLASPGANFLSMKSALRHYLKYNEPPSLVAVGVYVNIDGLDNGLSPNVYFGLDSDDRKLVVSEFKKLGVNPIDWKFELLNRIGAYRHRGAIELILKYVVTGAARVPEFINGHLALTDRLFGPPRLPASNVAGFKLAMLRDLLQFARERGIKVVLFEPPNTPGFSDLTIGREAVLKEIDSIVSDGLAVGFASFNDAGRFPFDYSEWINVNHLNSVGASRFSKELLGPWIIQTLSERCDRVESGQTTLGCN